MNDAQKLALALLQRNIHQKRADRAELANLHAQASKELDQFIAEYNALKEEVEKAANGTLNEQTLEIVPK